MLGEGDEYHHAASALVEDAYTIADLVDYSVNLYLSGDDSLASMIGTVWQRRGQ